MSKNLYYDVVIIGGGASGLFSSALIRKDAPNISALVLEKLDRVGKKLMLTGNGRCNLTNLNVSSERYHGGFLSGAEHAISELTPRGLLDILENFGLITTADSEGRVYPYSRQANSVLDILRLANAKFGTDIMTDAEVRDVKKTDKGFRVKYGTQDIMCKKLIFACGSISGITKSSGTNMYDLICSLGHSITPLYPALSPVAVRGENLRALKGIRALGKASIIKDREVLCEACGEIQFAENSLSGICIFDLSYIANSVKNTVISLDLLPNIDREELFFKLKRKLMNFTADAKAEELLIGYFSRMLGLALLKEGGIQPSKRADDITDDELKALCTAIKDWRFDVIPKRDFARSQVTAGGISGNEIDPKTMMSKKHNGLYVIGEMLDCNGDCGGFNLHFAFATAYCAAKDITE